MNRKTLKPQAWLDKHPKDLTDFEWSLYMEYLAIGMADREDEYDAIFAEIDRSDLKFDHMKDFLKHCVMTTDKKWDYLKQKPGRKKHDFPNLLHYAHYLEVRRLQLQHGLSQAKAIKVICDADTSFVGLQEDVVKNEIYRIRQWHKKSTRPEPTLKEILYGSSNTSD